MKNTLIVVFAVIALALGAVCVVQSKKLAGQETQQLSLRGEVEQRTREIADLQASQKLREQQRRALLGQADDLAEKLQARLQAEAKAASQSPAAATSASAGQKPADAKGGFGNLFAKMLEDPETKKLIRDQQRLALDQLYDPLLKQLALTPDEAAQFKDLLADNMMKGAEKATSLFGGDASTNRTEMIGTLAEEQKSLEEQVRGFLGETKYALYKDYQQTVGERAQLNQFRQQAAGSENALNDQQTERLLAIMKEEKQAVAATTGLPPPGETQDSGQMQAMFTGEGTERLLQSQETVNRQIYERAREVLSPGQLDSFGRFQTNQVQMMRVGMSMARKLLAPDQSEGSSPKPNQ